MVNTSYSRNGFRLQGRNADSIVGSGHECWQVNTEGKESGGADARHHEDTNPSTFLMPCAARPSSRLGFPFTMQSPQSKLLRAQCRPLWRV